MKSWRTNANGYDIIKRKGMNDLGVLLSLSKDWLKGKVQETLEKVLEKTYRFL